MLDIVDTIFEFLTLGGGDPEAATLTDAQRLRHEALARLLESPCFEVREWARLEVAGPVEFDAPPSRIAVGHVIDIGAGGMGISTWKPLSPGTGTAVRFADSSTGATYEFPAVVVWAREGTDPAMGVAFCAPPSRVRHSDVDSGRLRLGVQFATADRDLPGLEFADTGLIPVGAIE